ncbi:MAG: hypothetical protein L0027_00890 [Candidatus Rokubacteria bacterium]|nr:hypothetical protein [Candidatus Rokubacteria bacterium]
MDACIAYSLLTLVQDRAATVLKGEGGSPLLKVADTLLGQIKAKDTRTPRGLDLNLSEMLDLLGVQDVVGEVGSPEANDARGEPLLIDKLRKKVGDLGASFLDGKGPGAVRGLIENLWAAREIGPKDASVADALRRQLGIGISFVTTLRNLADLDLLRRIPAGWEDYFFADSGFETVDGIAVMPPAHGDLLAKVTGAGTTLQSFRGLKGLLNERSGEHYVRDMIRITVEVAADIRYGDLRARYTQLMQAAGDQEAQAKAARWFKGAASMAESMVTGVVEEACLGVSTFQTNRIIAAAAATYAGTTARKATQHVFLAQAGV